MPELFEAPVEELDAFEAPEEEIDAFEASVEELDTPVESQSRLSSGLSEAGRSFTKVFTGTAEGLARAVDNPLMNPAALAARVGSKIGSTLMGGPDVSSLTNEQLEAVRPGLSTLMRPGSAVADQIAKAGPVIDEVLPTNPQYEGEWMAQKIPNVLGQAVGQLTSSLIPAKLASVGSKALTGLGLSQAGLLGLEGGYKEAERIGVSESLKRDVFATLMGATEAGSESLGGFGTQSFSKALTGEMRDILTGNAAKTILKTGIQEGAEEVPAQIAGDILSTAFRENEAPVNTINPTKLDYWANLGEAFALGGIAGGAFGGVKAMADRKTPAAAMGLRVAAQEQRDALRQKGAAGTLTPEEAQSLAELDQYDARLGSWLEENGVDAPKQQEGLAWAKMTPEERTAHTQAKADAVLAQQAPQAPVKPSVIPAVVEVNAKVGNVKTAAALARLKAQTDAQRQQAAQEQALAQQPPTPPEDASQVVSPVAMDQLPIGPQGAGQGGSQGVEPVQQGTVPAATGGPNIETVPPQEGGAVTEPPPDAPLQPPPDQTAPVPTQTEAAPTPAQDQAQPEAVPVPQVPGAPVAGVEAPQPLANRLLTESEWEEQLGEKYKTPAYTPNKIGVVNVERSQAIAGGKNKKIRDRNAKAYSDYVEAWEKSGGKLSDLRGEDDSGGDVLESIIRWTQRVRGNDAAEAVIRDSGVYEKTETGKWRKKLPPQGQSAEPVAPTPAPAVRAAPEDIARVKAVVDPVVEKYRAAFTEVEERADTGDSSPYLDGHKLVIPVGGLANGLKDGAWSEKSIEAAMLEEVTHVAVDHGTARVIAKETGQKPEDITLETVRERDAQDWRALPKRVQQESERLYRISQIERERRRLGVKELTEDQIEAAIRRVNDSDARRGAEFKRQVMQDRIWGVLTEEAQINQNFGQWLRTYITELIAAIRDIASRLTDPAAVARLKELEAEVRDVLARFERGEKMEMGGGGVQSAAEPILAPEPVSPEAIQARLDQIVETLQRRSVEQQEEGLDPTLATEQERSYRMGGDVSQYRRSIPDIEMEALAEEAIGLSAKLAGGMTKQFGEGVEEYINNGKGIPGLPNDVTIRAWVGRALLDPTNDLARTLQIDPENVKRPVSQLLSQLGGALRAAANSIYDPLQKQREEVLKVVEKPMKQAGIENAVEFSQKILDTLTQSQKELVKNLKPEQWRAVLDLAQDDLQQSGWFETAMGAFDAKRKAMLEAMKKNFQRIAQLRDKILNKTAKSAPDVVAASQPVPDDLDALTVEQMQAELNALVAETSDMIDSWFARPKRKKKATPEQVETEIGEIETEVESQSERLTFTKWVEGGTQEGIEDFADIVVDYINPNGFNRRAFSQSLAQKFEQVDPALIDAVTNRVGDMLDGKTEETAKEPDYDARAKGIVARAVAQDGMEMPEKKKADALTELIQKRLKKQITAMEFVSGAKNLGVEPQSAFALNRKIEHDIEMRKLRREQEALNQDAAKLREAAIKKTLSTIKKPPTPNLPKTNKFVQALLHALNTGVLDSQAVRDAFAVAYDLHGLTKERLEALSKLVRTIESIKDGQLRETLMMEVNEIMHELRPNASLMEALYQNLMGAVLGGLGTMVAQFSGVTRIVNPLMETWNFMYSLDKKAVANPAMWVKVWLAHQKALLESTSMLPVALQGTLGGKGFGLGVTPTHLSAMHATQQRVADAKPSELYKVRIGRNALTRAIMGTVPTTKAGQMVKNAFLMPSWMASRSFRLIRAAEALTGHADKLMAFRQIAMQKLMADGMNFQKAWNQTADWMSPNGPYKAMWEAAAVQARQEAKEGNVSPRAIRTRTEEIVQDRLDEEFKLNVQNRHRELSAMRNFKAEPITRMGEWIAKIGHAPTPVKSVFLFSRFFANIYETALFHTPLGFIHGGKEWGQTPHDKMTMRQKRIVAAFGTLDNYRQYRDGLAAASSVGIFVSGLMMAAALAFKKWLDDDDDEPPFFWVTGGLPPSTAYSQGRQIGAAGWWVPNTLFIRIPGTSETLKLNYIQAIPQLAISLSAVGNMADRIMFPEMLNYAVDQRTGEREFSPFKATVKPMIDALWAPASRSTYVTTMQAIQRTFEGNPQSLAKLLGRPIGGALEGTLAGGPIIRDIDKLTKDGVPKASQNWGQAFMSGIPFAQQMGADTGLPMVNANGENITGFHYFPFFSKSQESSESVKKAAQLLNDSGITKEGPQEWMLDADTVEISHDGGRYLLTLDERASVLREIGQNFATELNDNAASIRGAETYDKKKAIVQRLQKKARDRVLSGWRDKIRDKV